MYIDPVRDLIQNQKINSVVLFGIESHVCILQTALDLRKNDIDVYVLMDGVSSINKQETKVAFDRMRNDGVILTTSESILFEILGDAAHPKFKAISQLIKETREDTAMALQSLL